MEKTGWAAGKAYESPVAEAIELIPSVGIMSPQGSNEDIVSDGESDW